MKECYAMNNNICLVTLNKIMRELTTSDGHGREEVTSRYSNTVKSSQTSVSLQIQKQSSTIEVWHSFILQDDTMLTKQRNRLY